MAKTGEPASFENYASNFDRWFDVQAVRVGDPSERKLAIFSNDSTTRKRVEEQIIRMNDALEHHSR